MSLFRYDQTFPTELFSIFNDRKIDSLDDLKSSPLHPSTIRFRQQFYKSISTFEKTYLMGYLYNVAPLLVFSDFEKIPNSTTFSNSVFNKSYLLSTLNIRVDIKKIETALNKIESNIECKAVMYENFYSQLLESVYKYCFIAISESIVISDAEGYDEKLCFQKVFRAYKTLQIGAGTSTSRSVYSHRDYIKNFENAFSNYGLTQTDFEEFTKSANMKTRFMRLILDNIIFEDGVSMNKQNKIIRELFKLVVCPVLLTAIEDCDIAEKLKKLRQRYS